MIAALLVEIDELVHESDAEGVSIELDVEEEDDIASVWLASIERTCGVVGAGSRALQKLIEICAEHCVVLAGAIEPPNSNLENYYAAQGFEIERHGHRTIITRTP